jgi:heme a synthase
VGMLSIVLCVWAFARENRRWVRWLAASVLGAVCFQGLLGGLRVVLVKLDLAIVHGCFAQAFFCLAALMALVTSRWWISAPDLSRETSDATGKRLIISGLIAVGLVYAQLVIGAVMRHEQAGLAVPDIPFVYGKLLPPTTAAELDHINSLRVWKLGLPAVTLGQIWLHYAHRAGALIVSLWLCGLALHLFLFHRRQRDLLGLGCLILALLAGQLVLGLATVYYRKPADVASAHVAVGALVLCATFVLTVRAMRLYGRGWLLDLGAAKGISMPAKALHPA